MTQALDQILGELAALVHRAYELGRGDRELVDLLLDRAAQAPVELPVELSGAPALVVVSDQPAELGPKVDVSALRPDDEPAAAPASKGRIRLWAEDDAALREMFAAGKTDIEIGRALGRTHQAIQQRRSVIRLMRGDSFAQQGVARRAEKARAASAQALTSARQSLGAPATPKLEDPAPAEPAEPVEAAAKDSSPSAPPLQTKAPATPAPDTAQPGGDVKRALERIRGSGCAVKGPFGDLWYVNNRPHTRAELLARSDRLGTYPKPRPTVAPAQPPARQPVPAPAAPIARRPAAPPPPIPAGRNEELAEIDAAIAAGKLNILPSGADLREIMKDVPIAEMDSCADWAARNGVKLVRSGVYCTVDGERMLTSEASAKIRGMARDRALDAWRAGKGAQPARAAE